MRKILFPLFASILLMATSTLVALAQNTGPYAPETHSFEPVDANQMVDLLTGDFTYVLPLMEVPGPEGGYPIVLSYHAGIAVDQEASWVGLGWNVNVGAINRGVNGVPDDSYGFATSTLIDHYPNPILVSRLSLGVTLNSVSLGVGFTWQSNKSNVDVDLEASVGYDIGGLGVGASISAGSSGVGIGARAGVAISGQNGSNLGSMGVAVGYHSSNGLNVGASLGSSGIGMGVSMTSQGASASISLAGGSVNTVRNAVSHTDYAHKVSGPGLVQIPIWFFYFGYGEWSHIYTLNDINSDFLFGSVYSQSARHDKDGWRQHPSYVLDSYQGTYDHSLLSDASSNELKPTFYSMAPDNFQVSGQGMSGSFKCGLFNYSNVFGRSRVVNRFDEDEDDHNLKDEVQFINYIKPYQDNYEKIHFYFNGTNAGHLRRTESATGYMGGSESAIAGLDSYLTGGDLVYDIGTESHYNPETHRTTSPQHVEYLFNWQIDAGVTPFWFSDAFPVNDRYGSNYFDPDGIGAFSVIAADGLRYNYSLPVYQFERVFWDYEEGETGPKQHIVDFGMYATSWLLTSITGPDYFDDGNGYPDENDYGYWVRFDYGKWTDSYLWQTPYGEDNEESYVLDGKTHTTKTFGRKQIYYLNQIKTKTHTALFIKDLREDGLGGTIDWSREATVGIYPKNSATKEIVDYLNSIQKTQRSSWENGNSGQPIYMSMQEYFGSSSYLAGQVSNDQGVRLSHHFALNTATPHKVLKLNRIVLLRNEDVDKVFEEPEMPYSNSIFPLVPEHEQGTCYTEMVTQVRDAGSSDPGNISISTNVWGAVPTRSPVRALLYETYSGHLQHNVLDVGDINSSLLTPHVLRSIEFNYESSLFDDGGYTLGYAENSSNENHGRLTLHSVDIRGRQGANVTPKYEFDYFNLGENHTAHERMDYWGFDSGSESLSDISSMKEGVKNWSMKTVLTPIGTRIDVDYESDSYVYEAAINYAIPEEEEPQYRFKIKSFRKLGDNIVRLGFEEKFFDIHRWFLIGENYRFLLFSLPTNAPSGIAGEAALGAPKLGECIGIDDDGWYVDVQYSSCGPLFSGDMCLLVLFEDEVTYYMKEDDIKKKNRVYIETCGYSNRQFWGGGVRVKSLSVSDANQSKIFTTQYTYRSKDGKFSSGSTIYAPVASSESKFIPYRTELPAPGVLYNNVTEISMGSDGSVLGTTDYGFNTFSQTPSSMTRAFEIPERFKVSLLQDQFDLGPIYVSGTTTPSTSLRHGYAYLIEDKLSIVGTVESVIRRNGSGEHVNSKFLEYNNEMSNNQNGVFQETFLTVKRWYNRQQMDNDPGKSNWQIINTSKICYSTQKEFEYEYNAGVSSVIGYEDFSIITGSPLTTRYKNSFNETYISRTIPAYTKYPEMGSKVANENNRHMLTQVAQENLYRLNGSAEWLIQSSVQTWSDHWNYRAFNSGSGVFTEGYETDPVRRVWRKKAGYIWRSPVDWDGHYPIDFVDFDFTETSIDGHWQMAGEVTRYDRNSHALESKDTEGKFAASKRGYGNSVVTASCAANYRGFAYSGAEDRLGNSTYFEGEVMGAERRYKSATHAHTGEYSTMLSPGQEGFIYVAPVVAKGGQGIEKGTTYRASVWLLDKASAFGELRCDLLDGSDDVIASFIIEGTESEETTKAGDWRQLNINVPVPSSTTAVKARFYCRNSSTSTTYPPDRAYFDDFRVHPISSPMNSYVYDPKTLQVSAILSGDNFATKFFYDNAGRLMATQEETSPDGFKVRKLNRYNYGRMNQ